MRGPLNVARPPQGYPVITQAGSSEDGKELAAQTAEVIFTAQQTLAEAQAFYADVKGRLTKYGRSPDDLKILSGYPLDAPLPDLPETNLAKSRQKLLIDLARRENLTIRQLYLAIAGARGH